MLVYGDDIHDGDPKIDEMMTSFLEQIRSIDILWCDFQWGLCREDGAVGEGA